MSFSFVSLSNAWQRAIPCYELVCFYVIRRNQHVIIFLQITGSLCDGQSEVKTCKRHVLAQKTDFRNDALPCAARQHASPVKNGVCPIDVRLSLRVFLVILVQNSISAKRYVAGQVGTFRPPVANQSGNLPTVICYPYQMSLKRRMGLVACN